MNRVQLPVDSHILQELGIGRVLCSRINDIMAKPTSKRHRQYLELLNRQINGYHDLDPADVYRERELVPTALAAYETRHGVSLDRGLFYQDPHYDFIGCCPDAVESDLIGISVHIRQTEETYERAIDDNTNAYDMRVAQASMAVTGLNHWLYLNYFEDRAIRKRRLSESLFERNPLADEMLIKMAWFWTKAVQYEASSGE